MVTERKKQSHIRKLGISIKTYIESHRERGCSELRYSYFIKTISHTLSTNAEVYSSENKMRNLVQIH